METITGSLKKVIFQKDGFLIGVISTGRSDVTVKGGMLEPQAHMQYELSGKWINHKDYGRQFEFSSFKTITPTDHDGIIEYIIQNAPGVGPVTASRIIETFGEGALRVCKENPTLISEKVKGISSNQAELISEALRRNEKSEEIEIGISQIFVGTRVSKSVIRRILNRYLDKALDVIKEDPYRLYHEISGIGFTTADRVAVNIGTNRIGEQRVEAGIDHVFRDNGRSRGSTCMVEGDAIEEAAGLLSVSIDIVREFFDRMVERGEVVRSFGFVALSDAFEIEERISEAISFMVGANSPFVEMDQIILEGLFPDQEGAVRMAESNPVCIVTGAPGTGKSTVIRHIIESFDLERAVRISLCAPTGKAARRITEQTGRSASTVHRLLEMSALDDDSIFKHHAGNKLSTDVVVVDEFSMMDAWLLDCLISAIDFRTRLILVGDCDQLPSVGPGNVLRDLIDSGVVPSVELTEIKRQNPGQTVINIHRIRDGLDVEGGENREDDFYFVPCDRAVDIQATIVDLVSNRSEGWYGVDRIKDVQVITPLRDKTLIGAKNLNIALQCALNPGDNIEGIPFRVGDKVIQAKNDYDLGIVNGDIGYILSIDIEKRPGRTTRIYAVQFENPDRIIEIPIFGNDLQLAYAMTVHKSQGSEWPVVVVPIHESFSIMLQRSLYYTAISRGSKAVIVVGQRDQMTKAINNNRQDKRMTNLCRMLQKASAVS